MRDLGPGPKAVRFVLLVLEAGSLKPQRQQGHTPRGSGGDPWCLLVHRGIVPVCLLCHVAVSPLHVSAPGTDTNHGCCWGASSELVTPHRPGSCQVAPPVLGSRPQHLLLEDMVLPGLAFKTVGEKDEEREGQ